MNDLYGIDPAATENLSDLSHLIGKFEVSDGRFIADLPVPWASQVREKMRPLLSDTDFKIAEEWFGLARKSMLPTEVCFDPEMPWITNASSLKDKAVALIGQRGCDSRAIPIDKILIERRSFLNASGGHIERTPKEYAKVARPLLQTSPKIVLIDPYFKLRFFDKKKEKIVTSWRHENSLVSLLDEAMRWNRVEIFKFMVSPDQAFLIGRKDDKWTKKQYWEEFYSGKEEFHNDLRKLFNEHAPGMRWEYGLLDGRSSIERHPRYLLGMQRGLQFDWGLDIDSSETTNHVHWMGEEELIPLLERFT